MSGHGQLHATHAPGHARSSVPSHSSVPCCTLLPQAVGHLQAAVHAPGQTPSSVPSHSSVPSRSLLPQVLQTSSSPGAPSAVVGSSLLYRPSVASLMASLTRGSTREVIVGLIAPALASAALA